MSDPYIPNPLCPWVQATDGTQVRVWSIDIIPAELTSGVLGVTVFTIKRKVQTWGMPYEQILGDGSSTTFGVRPNFMTDIAGSNFDPNSSDPKHQRGSISYKLGDALVTGIGIPLNRHVQYVLTFAIQ